MLNLVCPTFIGNSGRKEKNVMNRKYKKAWKKGSWKDSAIVFSCVSVFILLLEVWKEVHEFVIRRCRINLPFRTVSGEEVRVAFLSDLHGKCYGEENRELAAAIAKEHPDYILIGGDMLTRSKESTDETAITLLQKLVQICPVYLANGNHEQRLHLNTEQYGDRYAKYMKTAKALGVHVLDNRSEHIDMKGIPVTVSGLEVPLECYAHFRTKKLELSDIEKRIGVSKKEEYQILLAHNPVYFQTYAKWGADLTLSGHLHGGVINIPGIGALITPQAKLFPKYFGGTYQEGNKVEIVSRGLGTHTVNIRLFNPAEIVMITLCPGKDDSFLV